MNYIWVVVEQNNSVECTISSLGLGSHLGSRYLSRSIYTWQFYDSDLPVSLRNLFSEILRSSLTNDCKIRRNSQRIRTKFAEIRRNSLQIRMNSQEFVTNSRKFAEIRWNSYQIRLNS